MMSMILAVWPELLVGGAVLAAAGGALLWARRSGLRSQQTADLKRGAEDDAKATAAASRVDQLGDGTVDVELHKFDRH